MRKLLFFPFYPIILAPVPLLALMVINISQINLWSGWRLFMLSLLSGALLLVISWWLLKPRSRERSTGKGLLSIVRQNAWGYGAWMALFFIVPWNVWQYGTIAVIVSVLLLIGGSYLFLRKPGWLPKFTWGMNLLSVYMFVISGVMTFAGGVLRDMHFPQPETEQAAPMADAPDIYLVVVDSYAGKSVLMNRFAYDNQPFLDQLESLGFQTGECEPLGAETTEALSTSLNPTWDREGDPLWRQIRNNEVRAVLESRGYQIVAYETGFVWDEWADADVYLHPDHGGGMVELESLVVKVTPLVLLDGHLFDAEGSQDTRARARTYLIFDSLAWSAMDESPSAITAGPQFIFAHIVQPHPPFVFDAHGNEIRGGFAYSLEEYDLGYIAQLAYMNTRLVDTLGQIVSLNPNSIILVTGDHGPRYAEENVPNPVICAVYSPIPLPLDAAAALAEIAR